MHFFVVVLLCAIVTSGDSSADYTQYVDPFYGTQGGGNMFPGVVPAPFSVVKVGPDLYTGGDNYAGYASTGNVTGFSLMHESGTGGSPKYGTVAQLPVVGNISNPLEDLALPRAADDQASVGWYQTSLSNGVVVQLAGTSHAGYFNYSFPSSSIGNNVVIDVSHILQDFRGYGWEENYINGSITINPDGHYEGYGTYDGGWNLSPDWTIHFCGYFDSNASSIKTFVGSDTTLAYYGNDATQAGTERVGAVYTFGATSLSSRVGISWISSEKACSYVDNEIPASTTLDSLVSASKSVWNQQVFSKITTNSGSPTDLEMLYTNMYGMHIIPSNRTGDMPGWSATESYYDDWFTLWDLFRCTTPLLHILQPTAYTEIIQSLINVYSHEGWMPDARSSNYNGRSQGGSNADNVLADAYVKGVQVDWATGWQALLKDAEVTPPNNHDPISPDSADNQGRGALPDWLKYGYITPTYNRAVSRAIEYSANDFALYQVATGLGYTDAATTYLTRSRNWRNHYSNATTSLNFTGFLVPRYANGSFDTSQDPLDCGGCYWGDAYYEATPWEYLFNPLHDIAHLIALSGGPSSFTSKLTTIFTPGLGSNTQFNSTIINPGNEPSFTSPYLFHFASRPALSVLHSRAIARSYYTSGPSGLPGNSDAGAMQSWWLWSFIGLYPLTSQPTFLIGSPWLDDLTVVLNDDGTKTLRITKSGGTGDYVQSLRVNGEAWERSWVSWTDVFEMGGTMEFVVGEEEGQEWGRGDSVPPSPASESESF